MKTKKNLAIKALRKILLRTQAEFAAMIGVSKRTVIAWENGQNRLEHRAAETIAAVTGADIGDLLDGKVRVNYWNGQPYSAESFASWRGRECFGEYLDGPFENPTGLVAGTPEDAAREWAATGAEYLEKLFLAAARPAGKIVNRLPSVHESFQNWLRDTAKAFRLGPQIQAINDEMFDAEQAKQAKAKTTARLPVR